MKPMLGDQPEPLGTLEPGEVQLGELQPLALLHPTPEIRNSHEYRLFWIGQLTPALLGLCWILESWFGVPVLQSMETPSVAPLRTHRGCRGPKPEAQQGRPGQVGQVRPVGTGLLLTGRSCCRKPA